MPIFSGGGSGFAPSAPGAIGGTTSNTGQFTNVAIGASVPTLDGLTGDLTITGQFATGGNTPGDSAGDVVVGRPGGAYGKTPLGAAGSETTIDTTNDAASNPTIRFGGLFHVGNVYINLRNISFSNLPAASSDFEGALASIPDSTTAVWGATITGGGTHHVMAYCDGTNWTVAAS